MMSKKLLCFSANYSSRLYIVLSAFALSLGGIIYIFLRKSDHVFNSWMNTAGLDNWVNFAKYNSPTLSLFLPEWIVFSLPHGLWAFAYALIITGIWAESKSWLRYFWMASIPILVLGFELLQYAGIINGTFCIQDLALGVAGLILGYILGNKIIKSNNHEKAFK